MTVADLEVLGPGPGEEEAPRDSSGKKITGRSPTKIALERLRKDKIALLAGGIVLILVLAAIFAPLICKLFGIGGPYDTKGVAELDLATGGYPAVGPPFHPFTWDHPLGITPNTGYDNLSRLLYGLRVSMGIALGATFFTTLIGIVMGLLAGYTRGWPDRIISFMIDLFLSFPFLLGALALAPIITSRFATEQDKLKWVQFFTLMFILIIFSWMFLARLIRGQVLSLREREFIQSAQVLGAPTSRILFKEMLPNLIAPIVVSTSLLLPAFVAAEAGLSFLGIGITGFPSLGQTILRASDYYKNYPLYFYAPVLVVTILVVTLNLLGDSIRDAFDPKTRR
jgi:ABC-type dipeptide/oligopeptide/nickel transport system permease subunit